MPAMDGEGEVFSAQLLSPETTGCFLKSCALPGVKRPVARCL
jgi:hypothetical protein